MALDTRDRRASASAGGLDFLTILPNPDGTIDTEDRLHLSALYRGIAAAAAVIVPHANFRADFALIQPPRADFAIIIPPSADVDLVP